ncbi:MAG: hypothetical protein EPN84_12520 [Legionella sp.]|nr:MAG: hypothetical protein EPN84_12520 [Legionella sp.]
MKTFLINTFLGFGVLASSVAGAYGSDIDLGVYQIYPGYETTIDLAKIALYPDVTYNLYCHLKAVDEESHLKLKVSNRNTEIWVEDCTTQTKLEVTCPIKNNKLVNFGFRKVTKDQGTISIRNLDFNQTFIAKCIAKVSS